MTTTIIDSDALNAMSSAYLLSSTRTIHLIDRAAKLPYCKRHILQTKILFWQKAILQLCERVVYGNTTDRRSIDMNDACRKFLLDNNLVHPDFVNFFFTLHEPLSNAFLKHIREVMDSGYSPERKVKYIIIELTELLNISRIELSGMDLSCDIFNKEPVCVNFNTCKIRECKKPSNVFTLVMCAEYFMEPGLFDKIIENVGAQYDLKDIVVVIDYQNMRSQMTKYNWANSGGKHRRETCMAFVKEMYYYNWEGFVLFGKYQKELAPVLLKNKKDYQVLKETWRDKKELVYFA